MSCNCTEIEYCQACQDLKEANFNPDCPEITAEMCASLGNDTGLKPELGRNDCEDLNNLNDCLLGRVEEVINKEDKCGDWRSGLLYFLKNIYTIISALICAICGIWEALNNICTTTAFRRRINAIVTDPASIFYDPLSDGLTNFNRIQDISYNPGTASFEATVTLEGIVAVVQGNIAPGQRVEIPLDNSLFDSTDTYKALFAEEAIFRNEGTFPDQEFRGLVFWEESTDKWYVKNIDSKNIPFRTSARVSLNYAMGTTVTQQERDAICGK